MGSIKKRFGAKGWKSIDLYRFCSLEGLKSGVTIISYVVSTLYQLLYKRRFLLDLSILRIPQTPLLHVPFIIYLRSERCQSPSPLPKLF